MLSRGGDGVNSLPVDSGKTASATSVTSEEAGRTRLDLPTETETEAVDEANDYQHGIRLAMIIASLAASVFLVALDETIITTAIPRITDEFYATNDIGWYGSAYFMTFASFQLIYGKLFKFYSVKVVFLAAVVIFEIGSLICATAPSTNVFIFGRALAGVGSAGINAGFIVILAASLPISRRPLFVSCYSGMYGIAAFTAPLLGGFFTTKVTWRWCFYINLPIGGSAFVAMLFFLHVPQEKAMINEPQRPVAARFKQMWQQMDILGTAVLIPGIIALLLALQMGGTEYAWGNGRIIALLAVASFFLLSFIGVQVWKQDAGTVPPRIIKQRSVLSSALYVFFAGGVQNCFNYFLPIWFQAIQNVTALKSGIQILPTTLGTVLFSVISGILVAKLGYYIPVMISGAVLVIGANIVATLHVHSPAAQYIGYQFILGAGAGLGVQQAHTAAQRVLNHEDVPTGAVILIFSQILGGTIWTSVAERIFTNQLVKNLRREVEGLDAQDVIDAGATGLRQLLGKNSAELEVVLEVYNEAVMDVFLLGGALAAAMLVVSFGVEWLSVRDGDKVHSPDEK